MTVFDQPAYDRHQAVHFVQDEATGLRAIIAIHSTARGPAAGGCRLWQYENDEAALIDALRLSRGMSYKNAIARLPLGGGKAVILRNSRLPASAEMLEAFGRAVEGLGGQYITAEDVGITVDDMAHVARTTRYVSGLRGLSGDPSPKTARGVFNGIRTSVRSALQRDDLEGLKVAVQGLGGVGYHLCAELHAAGAKLIVADLNAKQVERAQDEFSAEVAPVEQILFQRVDVLAPCALGGILNERSIPRLQTSIVAGGANNQLLHDEDGERLRQRGILYAPDYVINAGGIISVASTYLGTMDQREVADRISGIGQTLSSIFDEAKLQRMPTNRIADALARARLAEAAGALN